MAGRRIGKLRLDGKAVEQLREIETNCIFSWDGKGKESEKRRDNTSWDKQEKRLGFLIKEYTFVITGLGFKSSKAYIC